MRKRKQKSKEKESCAERFEPHGVKGLVEDVFFYPGEMPALDERGLLELEFIFGKVKGVDLDVSKG